MAANQTINYWTLLADVAWSSPGIVRPGALTVVLDVQGVNGAQGDAVEQSSRILSDFYFYARTLDVSIGIDASVAAEANAGAFLDMQLTDLSRQTDYANNAFAIGGTAGRLAAAGHQGLFEAVPMAFLPGSQIKVVATPQRGFPFGAHSLSGQTTRRVATTFHGYYVNREVALELIKQRRQAAPVAR